MPKDDRTLVIFISSPSDLEPERNVLEEVVKELNVTWGRNSGMRLDVVRWETHGYPGIGSDPQDVLNRQLPDDYDIFIGLMWSRFGTPTGRAGSGTEEEFQRAYSRFKRNQSSIEIMFYFKDEPLAPSTLDLEQMAKIKVFRSSLGKEGVLYWSFSNIDHFEQLARLHLSRQIQQFTSNRQDKVLAPTLQQIANNPMGTEDDIGLLDLLEMVEIYTPELTAILDRIAQETLALGTSMEEQARELNQTKLEGHGQVSRREVKTLISKAAVRMNQYAMRMKTEMPIFREIMKKSMDVAIRSALIAIDLDSQDRQQAHDTRTALAVLAKQIDFSAENVESFQKVITGLPRLTTELNKAKRETAGVLGEMLSTLKAGKQEILEALKTVDTMLEKDRHNSAG
jgi:Domain of unknown function (DUF4062)